MVNLCHKEWEAGTLIDDYFYELRTAAVEAGAPLRMACLLLTGKLPPAVQGPMKDWVTERNEITKAISPEFMIAVRKSLTEKGIAWDRGYRDLNRVMLTQPSREDEAHLGSTPNTGGYQIPCEPQSSEPANMSNDAEAINSINYARRGRQISGNRPFYAIKPINKRYSCYIC